MKTKGFVLFLFMLSSLGISADDAALFDYSGVRKQGMGGVFVATSLDNSALYENPAGIYYASSFQLPRVAVHYNEDFVEKSDQLNTIIDVFDQTQDDPASFGTGEIVDGVEAYNDLTPFEGYGRLNSTILSFSTKGIGLGLRTASFLEAELPGGSNTIRWRSDISPSLAYAKKVNIYGPTIVGVSLKYHNRFMLYDKDSGDDELYLSDVQMIQIINGREDVVDVGYYALTGIGFDLGFLRPVNIKGREALIGLNFKNIGATISGTREVNVDDDDTEDETVEQDVPLVGTIGMSISDQFFRWMPYFGRFTRNTTVAVDYNFTSPYDDFDMNFHAGIEQELFGTFLKLRGGINQGFVVGGVGVDLKLAKIPLLQFDYAHYTEELGDSLGYNYQTFQTFKLGLLF